MNTAKPQIYLASSSPRRQQLLDQIKIRYQVVQPDVKESPQTGESPVDYAVRVAIEKARCGFDMLSLGGVGCSSPVLPVLGADTVVTLDNKIIGKPNNKADGIDMLKQLSGKCHDVITAVALVTQHEERSVICTVNCKSTVSFRQITTDECELYWLSKEPHDKAGSYAIQGIAAIFINDLSGSYSGVMGLPLFETAKLLQNFGIKALL